MPFTKLDAGIIRSSLWSLPSDERIVWITLLAMADEEGFVSTSFSGLVRSANVSEESTRSAIEKFEKPDAESRTQDNDGIRIRKIEGGWIILNYLKYRERTDKDFHRDKMKRYRERCSTTISGGSTTVVLPSASASVSVSASDSGSSLVLGGAGGSDPAVAAPVSRRKPRAPFVPPTWDEFNTYCKSKGFGGIARRAFDGYEAGSWHDAQGKPIVCWKQKLINGWFRDDNRDKAAKVHVLPTRYTGA